MGREHQAHPAHRRQLHDPVRRGRRSAHRARLPLRRLRHRAHARWRHREQRGLHPPELRPAGTCRRRASVTTSAPSPSRSGGAASASSSRALAGYIAYAIADRPGIAPGFVAGAVAVFMNAGFIGGIVGGLLAGVAAWWIGSCRRAALAARPDAGRDHPAARVDHRLRPDAPGARRPDRLAHDGAQRLAHRPVGHLGIVLLGIILGLMMCFDLGGPSTRSPTRSPSPASASGIATTRPFEIMAAVMAAGMVPPLAMALASTVLVRNGFTTRRARERQGRVAARCLVHLRGRDPVRRGRPAARHPGVDGRRRDHRCAEHGVPTCSPWHPHGGIFVFFAINPIWGFLVALLAGTVVTGFLVVALKRFWGAQGAARKPNRPCADVTAVPV